MEGAIESRFCDQQGNCRGVLPGTKGLHNFLHDNVGAYRAWHHSPLRVPTHTLITVLALALASVTVLQLTKDQPAQAATGIFAEFPFQGRLTNSDGTVVANASYDAVFQLYTVDTGGSAVWTESHTGASQLSTTDGIFNTMLGSISSLAGIDFNQDEYWLGITVGADAEMTPRIRLGAAPYAFNTDKLDGVSGEAFLQLNGQAGGQTAFGGTAASENLVLRSTSNATKGNVIIADDGGLVGVGLADPFQTILGSVSVTPTTGIHLDGGLGTATILLEGSDPSLDFVNYTAGVDEKWSDVFQSTGGYLAFYSRDDTGALIQAVASPILSLNNTTGNIGLGTNAPTSFKLEVVGSVGPNADDTYDLGSSSLRWQDLYLGPTSLHLVTNVAETATARDWKLTVDETDGATDGDLRIQEGSNSYFGVSTAGNVVLGSAALATTATDGFLYTPSTAGVPTGVPTTYTGRVPLTYNTASNILYFYNGGWQPVSGGGGITGSGAAGRVTVWSGASAVTSDAEYLYDSANNRLSIGTTPSTDTAAVINIPNNKFISARNAANTANIDLIKLDASNQISLGYTSVGVSALNLYGGAPETLLINNTWLGAVANMSLEGALSVYNQDSLPANVATTGAIRIRNTDALVARNSTNSADINLISLGASDQIAFGYTSSGTIAFDAFGGAPEKFLFNNTFGAGAVANMSLEGALSVYDTDGLAGPIATTGAIRLKNNASISARNTGNTADISLISLDSNNQIAFGYTSTGVTAFNLYGGAPETLLINNTWVGAVANTSVEGSLSVYNQDGLPANVANTGAIRVANGASLMARNSTNTADISLISLDSNNQIAFGYTSTGVTAINLYGGATETLLVNNTWTSGAVANLSVEGAILAYNSDSMSSPISVTGNIRLPNLGTITGRNQADSGDLIMMKVNSSDQLETGSGVDIAVGGDFYDTTIPASVSATALCIAPLGQIGTCSSDERLKRNISDVASGLSIIEQLSPKTYDFVSGQNGQSGFLAQDVQKVLPGLVTKDTGDDYLSLNYDGILAYAVKAIQEMNGRIDELPVTTGKIPKNIVVTTIKTGDLTVSGSTQLNTLDVADIATIGGTLDVKQTLTAEMDLIVKNNLVIAGAIIGTEKTRGINISVEKTTKNYVVSGLNFLEETPYAVSITPSWITNFAVTDKTKDGFKVNFSTPAPDKATFDYFVQQ